MVDNKITILMPIFGESKLPIASITGLIDSGFLGPILLIDDKYSDITTKNLSTFKKQHPLQIKIIENPENLGYTKSINIGLKNLLTEYVLIINSDAFIVLNTLTKLLRELEKNIILSGISPVSDNAGNASISRYSYNWQDFSSFDLANTIDHIEKELLLFYGPGSFVQPSINGFCTLWKIRDLENIGYFDEINFPIGYGEEDDICLSLGSIGKFVAVTPTAFVPHLRTQSFLPDQKNYLKALGKESLKKKWGVGRYEGLIDFFARSPLNAAHKEFGLK